MKRFKKIYIEITNICNLNCSFCQKDLLPKKEMNLDEFEEVIKKINNYTDYVYLHLKGEPLMHSNIKGIIDICKKYKKYINITTNGTLLKKKYTDIKGIRELNVSLQSIIDVSILDEIFDKCEILSNDTFVEYRLWVKNNLEKEILTKIKNRYNTLDNKLSKNIYLSFGKEFIWPDLNNKIIREEGSCYGTKDHIGILSDGTVVPCCLDGNKIIELGNIFKNNLEEIINSEVFLRMNKGFKNNKLTEELCKKCGFKENL